VLFFVFGIGTFTIFKSLLPEDDIPKIFRKVRISCLLFIATLINHGCYLWIYKPLKRLALKDVKTVPISPNMAIAVSGIIILITLFSFIHMSTQDGFIHFMEKYIETNILDLLGFDFEIQDLELGDVHLCTSLTSKKKVILKGKDRFLHSLILGPTGSGKTSQIIIPMINQDIQNFTCGLTVIEPKGDLAEKVAAMGQHYGRPVIYFNPILEACPSFNPLFGKEEDVVENITTTFKMLNPDSSQYFQDMNEQILRNALSLLKRLKQNNATLIDLHRLVSNVGGEGRKMVTAFAKLPAENSALAKENEDISNYFLGEYLAEKSKTYENCSGVRSQVAKLVSNKFLRKVLNPDDGKSDIDFSAHLAKGGVIAITTAQGKLRDLGKYLGYFLILNFQSAVFKRPGTEDTRKYHFLYIDEFQVYSNPGFADMLTQGRSYRVASHLATQNRALIGMGGGSDSESFVELVSTNARNLIVYPGGNYADAKFYSDQFGQILERTEQKGISRKKWNPLYGFSESIGMPTESVRVTEEYKERFRPDEIIYRPFGEITFVIIKDNSLQIPDIGGISYIPMELNKLLNTMVLENNILMMKGFDPNEYRDLENGGVLKPIVYEQLDMEKYMKVIVSDSFDDESLDSEDISEEDFSTQMDSLKEKIGIDEGPMDEELFEDDVVIDKGIASIEIDSSLLLDSSGSSDENSGFGDIFEDFDVTSIL